MAQLCTENLFSLTIVARSELEEGKKWVDFATLAVYACFVGEWNPKMASQTKRDPFTNMGHKSAQLPCFERVQHLKEKSSAKNFLAKVIRAVPKVNLCEENFWC